MYRRNYGNYTRTGVVQQPPPPIVAFPSENLLYSGLSPWGKNNFIVDLFKKYGFSPPHPRVFDSDFSKMKYRMMPNYLTIDEIIVGFENERLIDPKKSITQN